LKIEFDVKMTTSKMYDYMLKHNMTSFAGILGEFIGIILVFGYVAYHKWAYLAAGIVIIMYMPVTLYLKSKRQVTLNPAFKEPLHYMLNDEGITVSSGEASDSVLWSQIYKVTSTNHSIIVYTNRVNACIFPKEDLGADLLEVVQCISSHVEPKKVNIR